MTAQAKIRATSQNIGIWVAVIWLIGVTGLLLVDWLSTSYEPGWLLRVYFAATVILSCLTFLVWGLDKRRAVREQSRIAEKHLHLLSLAGGWPGALIAQRVFRHKTIKPAFRAVLWLIVTLHVTLSVYAAYPQPAAADSAESRSSEQSV